MNVKDVEKIAREICEKYGIKEKDEVNEIKTRLKALLIEYRIPEKEAIRSVTNYIMKNRKTEIAPIEVKISEIENIPEGHLVTLTVKVLKVFERAENRPSAALIGDESGICRMTWWDRKKNTHAFAKGKCYRIEGARVTEFRERKEIQLLDTTIVKEVEADIKVPEVRVEFAGAVVEVSRDSGLVPVCPECGRYVPKKTCPEHGKVKPEIAYKAKLVLDNGQECVSALFKNGAVEKLTGLTKKEALQIAKEELTLDVIRGKIEDAVFGKYITVKGRKIRDIILVDEFEFLKPNPTEYVFVEEVIDFPELMKEEEEEEEEEKKREEKKKEKVEEEYWDPDEDELNDPNDLLSILNELEG